MIQCNDFAGQEPTPMSTVTTLGQPVFPPAPLASSAVYRMTVGEFERIAEYLNGDAVELVDGYLVGRDDMNPPHVLVTERLRRRFDRLIPAGWFTREDKPIRIPDFDEPRPDLAIVRGDPELYATNHPGPADVALVAEVSLASLDRDQGLKMLGYARGGIPVYWIVNLVARQIEVYTDPRPDGYGSKEEFKAGEGVPVVVAGATIGRIAVADLLP
jgi:Uma2 family endonuclease